MIAEASVVRTVRDQIADQLRSDLIAGVLKPGERLREEELASRFGVSRGPIRDVLIQLTKEGILISRRNAGVIVANMPSNEVQKLLIDLRIRIETYSVKQVCGNLSPESEAHLNKILEVLRDALEEEDFTKATKTDILFHQVIVELAGGDELKNIWLPIVMRMRMNYQRISAPDDSISEHKAILHAISSGKQAEAVSALKANIR